MLKSIEKNKGKRESEIVLEGSNEYIGNYIDIGMADREWFE
jgi:hypothetical protein